MRKLLCCFFQLHEDASTAAAAAGQFTSHYPGSGSKLQYVKSLNVVDPDFHEGIPVYQVLNTQGVIENESEDPKVKKIVLRSLGFSNLG